MILAVLLIAAKPFQVAPNIVTNANDSGPGSLRQAIADAGINASDTINFDGDYTITLASELTIDKNLIVMGNGRSNTVIQASTCNPVNSGSCSHDYRAVNISGAVTVELAELTIQHGRLSSGSGAGIYNNGATLIKLGMSMSIVGVPQSDSGWDVTWLGNSAGYLAGSAFPTWAGNTVITGHVWDAFNCPGAFAELKSLGYGDQVQIHA